MAVVQASPQPDAWSGDRRSRRLLAGCAPAIAALVAVTASAAGTCGPRAFTVADSIEMTRIVDPMPAYRRDASHQFKRSPDGKRFIVVLHRGHLETNQVEYQLLLFTTKDVLAAVSSGRAQGRGLSEVLVSFRTSSGRSAIESVRWQDSDTLTFIGRNGAEEAGQVYSIDLRTRSVRELTDSSTGVLTYDVASTGAIVYSAPVFSDWQERNQHGYVVGSTWISSLTITDPKDAPTRDVGFFVKGIGSGAPSRLDVGLNWIPTAIGTLPLPDDIAISPDGRWAVVLATVRSIPSSWAEYKFIHEYLSYFPGVPGMDPDQQTAAALEAWAPNTPLAPRSFAMKEFFLVDVARASARPLLDAPGSWGGYMVWSPDSTRLVLAPTFLPLDIPEGQERARRRSGPSIVEVKVPSGSFARITDRTASIGNLTWMGNDSVRIQWQAQAENAPAITEFHKRDGRWAETRPSRLPLNRLQLRIREGMNTPPQVAAIDRETKKERVITDLNPQLQAITLGHLEVFEWRDRLNRRYRGGLLLPPNFNSGIRYPVVLQTYGFYPNEFLVDGPSGFPTAYAARALANKDMIVLQMPTRSLDSDAVPASDNSTSRYDRDGENPRFVAMMEGAIDALADRGLTDRGRVGLIGFSREGMHVQYAVTFSSYPIAAATIAHSVQATPFAYALSYGLPYPAGMLDFERQNSMIGAPFWGDGIKTWLERSPAFHLDNIRTPLRFEHLSSNVPEYWDTFVLLKRQQRPVEMIHLPLAGHQVVRPIERYVSEQGNVDWFAFWLKGEEDPDPAKAAQYQRWRILRQQHEAHMRSLN